ncbi:transposase [Moorena sp. SIO4G3]|uniref:transposase n=1 Tax=Moorena sp. SIO4G3 TaxID=2607821 RepID=UPI0025F9BA31|nr:transposase [Moorena sp. SIO4G3]
MQGTWALPLLHERITSFETPLEKAALPLKLVCEVLDQGPISLWDSEYGCASFIQLTADTPCDKLMRLRSNRVLYGPPPDYCGRGRPRKHGQKFKLSDQSTWWLPEEKMELEDEKLSHLRIRCWGKLHFYNSAAHPMELILVERLDETGQRTHRPLWLVWTGETRPALDTLWSVYLRRFCVDHWDRFIKQRLHWCLPHLGTAEQTAVWSALMPLMTWQLWPLKSSCPRPSTPMAKNTDSSDPRTGG